MQELIMALHNTFGNSWSQIAARLPGRSDNEIKNFWNAPLRKKLRQKERKAERAEIRRGCGGEADRKPEAEFFIHNSARAQHQGSPAGDNDDGSSNGAVGTAVHRADEPRTDEAILADAGHRINAVADDSVARPSTSAEATRDHGHGDGGFLLAMVDDEAGLLLGEYYGLDVYHDGLFWRDLAFG